MSLLKAVLIATFAASCLGHICMWSPMQRNGVDISFPGARECFRQKGPCGWNEAGAPLTTLKAGSWFKVEFQQNLNHYTFEDPGYLDASIALVPNPREEDFQPFGRPIRDYAAYNMITQTNFSIVGEVPNRAVDHAVIRVRYVSNNPKEDHKNGTTFYNCADVRIVQAVETADPAPGPNPCCTAPLWQMKTFRTGSWRDQTRGIIAYDKKNQLMRIDEWTGSASTSGVKTGSYKMWLHFQKGIQWYMDDITKECYPYALDLWADWCYGTKEMSQTFWQNTLLADTVLDTWFNGEFVYSATHDKCTPVSLFRTNGDLTIYSDFSEKVDPALFQEDTQYCKRVAMRPASERPPVDWKTVVAEAGHPAFASLLKERSTK